MCKYILPVLAVIALFLACLLTGSVTIPLDEWGKILSFQAESDSVYAQILYDIRLPRTLAALLAGAALSLAGLQMQTIFRNPLADPFVLGVSSGASLGVAFVLLATVPVGAGIVGALAFGNAFTLALAASIGSGLVLALMLVLSGKVGVMTLLIVGLMLSYLIGAVVSILIFFSMPERLQSYLAWSFGQFGSVTWTHMPVFAPVLLLALAAGCLRFKALDAFLLGEEQARALGENVLSAKIWILASAAILAGTVTAFCGPIGFIGVAVPHLARGILKTHSHRELIPLVLLLGAAITMTADLISRLPGSSATLPVNAVTSLIGAPVIVWVLLQRRHLN